MYDPAQCSDTYCEWIELYNPTNQTISTINCSIGSKEIGEHNITNNSYFIIARNKENFTHFFLNQTSENNETNMMGMNEQENILQLAISLTNDGEEIILEGTEYCQDSFDYTTQTEQGLAKGNNYSLERREDGTWGESLKQGGSPLQENSIFSFSTDYNQISISEFLPDPYEEDDALKPFGEWVELYNAGSRAIDLKSCFFTDQNSENELYIAATKTTTGTTIIEANNYLTVYRDADSDFSLNNNGYDELQLYSPEEELITSTSYSGTTEGMSWSLIDSTWQLTLPTPDQANHYQEGCDWQVYLELENNIFHEEDLNFNVITQRISGQKSTLTVRGKIEDLFGNTITEYSPWTDAEITSSNSKSYSPNLDEGSYQITFWVEENSCQDYNEDNNQVHELIAINPEYKKNESQLSIETLYLGSDDSAEWGDQFTAKVNIFKGDETKTAVELFATQDEETVSKRTKINVYDTYQNYTVTLPVQLHANCDGSAERGKASLVLEGFNLEVSQEFEIEGIDEEVCTDYFDYLEEIGEEQDSSATGATQAYQITDFPSQANPGESIEVTVQLLGDDLPHTYQAWAYLYNGPTCHSCQENSVERNASIKLVELKENELKKITLPISIDTTTDPGEYKIKVKLLKDELKTPYELTEDITLISSQSQDGFSLSSTGEEASPELFAKITPIDGQESQNSYLEGRVIYQSPGEKARALAPYFLLLASLLLSSTFLMRKT